MGEWSIGKVSVLVAAETEGGVSTLSVVVVRRTVRWFDIQERIPSDMLTAAKNLLRADPN